jgi:sensor histidine kinase regulating citrate/malate metabolism
VDVIYEKYNHSLLITIADDGKGLRLELATEHKSEKEFGMGLGLFLARATIERFSGTIRVNNYQTQGTQLEIKLPLVQT